MEEIVINTRVPLEKIVTRKNKEVTLHKVYQSDTQKYQCSVYVLNDKNNAKLINFCKKGTEPIRNKRAFDGLTKKILKLKNPDGTYKVNDPRSAVFWLYRHTHDAFKFGKGSLKIDSNRTVIFQNHKPQE